ncbi:MAG: CheY-like chemotaxis protein [Candidatus Latescibacterota bacterium]|jgi:CheY-like chemotaxis protein
MPRILFAEDGPTVMQLSIELLGDDNLTIDVATNGRQALDLINAESSAYQLVILGETLSDVSGPECVAFLRQMYRRLPTLMLVDPLTDDRRLEFGKVGLRPKHLLEKPTDPTTFAQWVQQALAEAPPRP